MNSRFSFLSFSLLSLAQVTQWDLVFFGTAEPTQPDDPPQTTVDDIAGRNELDHNSLEFAAGESGQWRDMQVSVVLKRIIYNLNRNHFRMD